jgi:hypothetical protein
MNRPSIALHGGNQISILDIGQRDKRLRPLNLTEKKFPVHYETFISTFTKRLNLNSKTEVLNWNHWNSGKINGYFTAAERFGWKIQSKKVA